MQCAGALARPLGVQGGDSGAAGGLRLALWHWPAALFAWRWAGSDKTARGVLQDLGQQSQGNVLAPPGTRWRAGSTCWPWSVAVVGGRGSSANTASASLYSYRYGHVSTD
jgi:hypothetical protein